MSLASTERSKYKECWKYDKYRHHSPGEWALPVFKQIVRKKSTLIDLGCGTGRAGMALSELGFDVTLLDFAPNCLDFAVRQKELPFIQSNLWSGWKGEWEYGYCCDVMEHIPPEMTDRVLKRIAKNCKRVFFTIHFGPDNFGKVVGHPLHVNIQGFTWWRDKLKEHFILKDARDLIGMGTFMVNQKG